MKATCICMEDHPGYPDPLFYILQNAAGLTDEQIVEEVIEQRIEELGEDLRQEVLDTFSVVFCFKGEVTDDDIIFDDRS